MKNIFFYSKYVAIFAMAIILFGCGDDTTPSGDDTTTIQMRTNLEDVVDVELSRTVDYPLSQTDAALVSVESGCACVGPIELFEWEGGPVDGYWGYIRNRAFPECAVFINALTGQTECTDDIEFIAGYFLANVEEVPWP